MTVSEPHCPFGCQAQPAPAHGVDYRIVLLLPTRPSVGEIALMCAETSTCNYGEGHSNAKR
jgi:hypothetical protein